MGNTTTSFGTAFAVGGFSADPNLSPNNQAFGAAVLAVVNRNPGTGGSGGGTGSVTSVGLVDASTTPIYKVTGTPITTSGTLTIALNTEASNTVFAGPATGAAAQPTFRTLTSADFPSGIGALITVFTQTTATSTWVAQPGTVLVDVICIGGGGGGGAGAKANTGTAAGGGAGGGGGGVSQSRFNTSFLGTSVVLTFGTNSGLGGTAQTAVSGGFSGQNGADARFGRYLNAYGGTGGAAGATAGSNGGAGGVGKDQNGSTGGAGASTAASGGAALSQTSLTPTNYSPTGGGGAGGVNTVPTVSNGGPGGAAIAGAFVILTGGTGGTGTGAAGGPGLAGGGMMSPSTGGGGGSGGIGGINGGSGGQGGGYGAGGGGGGGVQGSGNSGPGGAGATPAIIVVEWGNGVSGIAPANPSSKVSGTATNGVASSYMRSDAAPALDWAQSPTWTGNHIFNPAAGTPLVVQLGGTTAFEVVGTASVAGRGPTAATLVDMTPDIGTFTGTLSGMTTTVQNVCAWSRNGNQILLNVGTATGTSNVNTFTITGMPAEIQPTRTQYLPVAYDVCESGGALSGTVNALVTASSGTLTLQLGGSSSGWGNTLIKGVAGAFTLSYMLN